MYIYDIIRDIYINVKNPLYSYCICQNLSMFKMTTLNLPSWPCFRPGLGGTALFLAGLKRFAIDGPPEFLGDDETIKDVGLIWGDHGGPGMSKIL